MNDAVMAEENVPALGVSERVLPAVHSTPGSCLTLEMRTHLLEKVRSHSVQGKVV